jgi:hypothetical protein
LVGKNLVGVTQTWPSGEVQYQPLPGSLRNSITMALNEAAMSQEPGIPYTSWKLS